MFLTMMKACRTLLAATMLLAAQLSLAAPAGEVEFAQGLASAQQGGQSPRFLSKGDVLQEGDVLNTGAKGFAIIAFPDGSKVTLRPNTSFAIDQYNAAAGQEAAVFRLLKGGLRTITGAIGRAKPEAVRFSTSTATIGIRGTSFDARICDADCANEEARGGGAKPKPGVADSVVARVAVLTGGAVLTGADKQTRAAAKGAALYTGDTIRTEKGGYAVLAFRDETRITVASESEFRLENVRFTGDKSDSGSFAVRLVRGTARTLTGLLARRDPKAFQYSAGNATIGIRGTGFDTRVEQECAAGKCADSVYALLWDGSIALEIGQQSLLIPLNRAALFNALQNRLAVLDLVPQFFTIEPAPRPDRISVDDNLFSAVDPKGTPPGLYVNVRAGHIVFLGLNNLGVDLGRFESAYLGIGLETPQRLTRVPQFILNDPIPAPENFDMKLLRLLETLGDSSRGLICEM